MHSASCQASSWHSVHISGAATGCGIRGGSTFAAADCQMLWDTVCTVCDVAYRLLAAVYMLLAAEHYIRTYHPALLRRRVRRHK